MIDTKKIELSDEILTGITWRNVRDAFKHIVFNNFLDFELAAWLYREEIINILKKEHKYFNFNINQVRTSLSHGDFSIVKNIKPDEKIKITQRLINFLHNEKFIERTEDDKYWIIAPKGHSLRLKKSLKRISRTKAYDYLRKIFLNIKNYNEAEESHFFIDALWAYGSLIKETDNLGDLDLAVSYSKKKI